MSRKIYILLIAILGLLAAAGAIYLKAAAPHARVSGLAVHETRNPIPDTRNVVLIVLDALRADRVNAQRNGTPVMPNLARWAGQAVRFKHAVTPCTWTRPAMASIFTSLYVDTHQVYYSANPFDREHAVSHALPASLETMAAYLGKAGYATLGIQTNPNAAPELGFAQGFDSYAMLPNEIAGPVTSRALAELPKLKPPFFAYLHYMDPHAPYTPPESYRKLLGGPPPAPPEELDVAANRFMDYLWDYTEYRLGNRKERTMAPLSPAGEEAVRWLYDGEARYLDDELEKVLEYLREKAPNTVVIVIADHGEHFWEHGWLGHGLTTYAEELDVPFLIEAPGLEPREIERTSSTIGILPTVAALLGLPPNPKWQGRDLLDPSAPADAPVFSRTKGSWPECHTDLEMTLAGNLKLIDDRLRGRLELYDLAADPAERNDLAAQRPEDVRRLTALLDAHRQQNFAARVQSGSQEVKLDPETQHQLHDLGYGGPPTRRPHRGPP